MCEGSGQDMEPMQQQGVPWGVGDSPRQPARLLDPPQKESLS
jgi:hypothetical protein